MKTSDDQFGCSFCGRDKKEALILIAGIEGHICELCVEQAYDIVKQEYSNILELLEDQMKPKVLAEVLAEVIYQLMELRVRLPFLEVGMVRPMPQV